MLGSYGAPHAAAQQKSKEMTDYTFRMPSQAELNSLMRDAHELRAHAIAAMFASIGRTAVSVAKGTFSGLALLVEAFGEARRAQAIHAQLSRLSDRELADIGLTRSNIPAVVAGTFRRDGDQTAEPAAPARVPGPQPVDITSQKPAGPAKPAAKPAGDDVREAA